MEKLTLRYRSPLGFPVWLKATCYITKSHYALKSGKRTFFVNKHNASFQHHDTSGVLISDERQNLSFTLSVNSIPIEQKPDDIFMDYEPRGWDLYLNY